MTPHVKYIHNRRYKDLVIAEETKYFTKNQINTRLVEKKITVWDRVKDFLRK